MTTNPEVLRLARELMALEVLGDNALDVQVEVALFKPGKVYTACRPNAAGSKVIYTGVLGNEVTCWADDWTSAERRSSTLTRLRQSEKDNSDAD